MRRPGLDLDLGCYWWSDGSQICLPASLPTGPCLVDRVATFIFSRELAAHVGSPEVFARRLQTRSGRRCVERIRLQSTAILSFLRWVDRTPCTERHLFHKRRVLTKIFWNFRGWNFQFFCVVSLISPIGEKFLSLFCICKFREREICTPSYPWCSY